MNKNQDLVGTSGRNAIATTGGFNFSEFNIQEHDLRNDSDAGGYSAQDRQKKMYSGRNPLNPPQSTTGTGETFGINKEWGWRENKLPHLLPAYPQSNTVELTPAAQSRFDGSDSSYVQRAFRQGFGQNDPAIQHMIDEREIAPEIRGDMYTRADSYLHSDVGVSSVINQNLIETGTFNNFPKEHRQIVRGTHEHQNLTAGHTPRMINLSNAASGTHHRSGNPQHPVLQGTRGPLERTTLYSDFPNPAQPPIRPQEGPGVLGDTSNRGVFLFA